MSFQIKAGVTALALILAPLAAQAHHKPGHDNGGGNGRGHASQSDHGGGNAHGHDRVRGGDEADDSDDDAEDDDVEDEEDSEEAASANRPCAWGLASRGCVPPGQAAQGVTTDEWIGAPTDGYESGDDISDEDYGLIVNTDQLGLDTGTLEDGESYALVGDTIVVVDEEGTVVSVVRRAAFPGHSGG